MKNSKHGVFLINLGTPDSYSVGDVRRYLREFLMDGRVIDIPWLKRFLLINCIIAPFRAFDSAKGYQQLWEERGSPLKYYGYDIRDLVQGALGEDYKVVLGMRYQNPSIKAGLEEFRNEGVDRITVIPLYPQYASASTGSTIEKVMEEIKSWEILPHINFVSQFCEHPLFIKAFAERGRSYMDKHSYDHFIFSYHGLPERQILKGSVQNYCKLSTCCNSFHARNQYCYRAQCFQTTRLLVNELGIDEGKYTVSFQSRLGKTPWIKPYTDEKIEELVKAGNKKILVFSPSFISDCLETTVEIGDEYKEEFEKLGGERWDLVESLNLSPIWVECLVDLVKNAESGASVPVNN